MKSMKFSYPYLLLFFGCFLLLFMDQAALAGVCILVGIVMIIESIWPEKWGADTKKSC